MLVLEAIFAFLRRSLGSILRALFGWATLALFGEVREKERTFLTIVVAAAAVWPLLLVGTIFPRQAALLLAIVPVPRGTPESIVRGVWIGLTILIPFGVGIALSRRTDPRPGRRWRAALLGFPATLGIGLGFLFVCIAVPARKVAALVSNRKEDHVPLAIPPEDYKETAQRLQRALTEGGLAVERREAPWGTRALGRLLHVFAGAILGRYQPEELVYLRSPDLAITIYPNGVQLYGREAATARAHALIVESATGSPALLTMTAEAQEIEKRIKKLWSRKGEARVPFERELQSVARELAETPVGFTDWETLYRELLQVVVASRGASRLIQVSFEEREKSQPRTRSGRRGLRRAARRAKSYGSDRLRRAAAKGSLKLIEKLADRMLRMFAGR